jgi:LmeA-like phospholipid-binding
VSADADSAGPRRRWQIVVEAVAVAVVLALLVWGSESLARWGAQSLLEDNIQDVTGVADRPRVEVQGPVLLPQVLRGSYADVDVSVSGLRSGALRIERVDARLYDVRMPFRDVVLRDIRRIGIGRSVDQVSLRFQDLNDYFEITGREVRLSPAGDGQVQLRGFVLVLSQTIQATATAELSVDGNQLRVTPRDIDTAGSSLSPARRLLLEQRLTFMVPLDTLPFGRSLTGVTVLEDGVRLTAEGRTIILQP